MYITTTWKYNFTCLSQNKLFKSFKISNPLFNQFRCSRVQKTLGASFGEIISMPPSSSTTFHTRMFSHQLLLHGFGILNAQTS
jgi:hypothetical protein